MNPSQKQERGEKEECNGGEKRETREGGPLRNKGVITWSYSVRDGRVEEEASELGSGL